jgi:hypothetical protein
MKTITVLALLAVLVTAPAVNAAELATAPLSENVASGVVRCAVSNLTTSTKNVTVRIFDFQGDGVTGFGPTPLGAGATTETAEVDLSVTPVSHCRCTVPAKAKFRCSLVHVSAGGALTVIPAQ